MSDQYIAKTFFGLEPVLAEEIRALGGIEIEEANRAVFFSGNLDILYRANLQCRTALRILKPIMQFKAHNETVLYKRIRRFNWWELFPLDQTFAIDATVNSEEFTHSKYVALKVKDAIVDLFRHKFNGKRPSIDVQNPDIRINVHCRQTEFTISLDSSGESLHKRGYRQESGPAPLNEALAAGMLMLSGWDKESCLYDSMCGSGTILIEAAMLALNIAPRQNWNAFAFQKWQDYDDDLWQEIRRDAIINRRHAEEVFIHGTEKETPSVRALTRLIKNLGLESIIDIQQTSFFSSAPPCASGLIVTNPPYGHRVGHGDINAFYKRIGDHLKQTYNGWDAWILSGNKEALKGLGLKTSQRLTLYNGPIECKFHKYELYRGSRKLIHKNDPPHDDEEGH